MRHKFKVQIGYSLGSPLWVVYERRWLMWSYAGSFDTRQEAERFVELALEPQFFPKASPSILRQLDIRIEKLEQALNAKE